MGSAKNKSAAQQEKAQQKSSQKQSGASSSDGAKKGGGKKGGGKAEEQKDEKSSGIVVLINESEATNFVKKSKSITAQDLSRQLGVKVSTANNFLLRKMNEGLVKRAGGYSGHHIYQPAASS